MLLPFLSSQAAETRTPCRNIQSSKQRRSRAALRLCFAASMTLLTLGGNQVLAVVRRFVQCLSVVKGRKPASLLENGFQHQTF
jgi:hypothetical protein